MSKEMCKIKVEEFWIEVPCTMTQRRLDKTAEIEVKANIDVKIPISMLNDMWCRKVEFMYATRKALEKIKANEEKIADMRGEREC